MVPDACRCARSTMPTSSKLILVNVTCSKLLFHSSVHMPGPLAPCGPRIYWRILFFLRHHHASSGRIKGFVATYVEMQLRRSHPVGRLETPLGALHHEKDR